MRCCGCSEYQRVQHGRLGHQTLTLKRINMLLDILADPAVPRGARIRLTANNIPLVGHVRSEAAAKVMSITRMKALK